ncbi:MAG TPA: hypothetical protein VFU22_30155, partial [Roseiflexaceae bacterium]|nr:hypothetical protein [Roseiflexaceae bacterium]
FIYITQGYEHSGMRIFNVADPSRPTGIRFVDTPGEAYGLQLVGTLVYVANSYGGVHVIDVSDPFVAFEVGASGTSGSSLTVAVADGYTYVADTFGGLVILGPPPPPATATPTATLTPTDIPTATPLPPGGSRVFLPVVRRDEFVPPTPTPTSTPTPSPTATPPVPTCDPYEPNDSRSSPFGPLVAGQGYAAKLCTADPEDNYYFDTTTASPVQLTLTLPPSLVGQVAIWLYKQGKIDTTLCGTGPVTKATYVVSCPIPSAGRYIVRLYTNRSDNANFYGLLVTYQ